MLGSLIFGNSHIMQGISLCDMPILSKVFLLEALFFVIIDQKALILNVWIDSGFKPFSPSLRQASGLFLWFGGDLCVSFSGLRV